jgi:hypothetical protein
MKFIVSSGQEIYGQQFIILECPLRADEKTLDYIETGIIQALFVVVRLMKG